MSMHFSAWNANSKAGKLIISYRTFLAYFMTVSFLGMQYFVAHKSNELPTQIPETNIDQIQFVRKRAIDHNNNSHNIYKNHIRIRNFLNFEYDNNNNNNFESSNSVETTTTLQAQSSKDIIRFDEPSSHHIKYNLRNASVKYSSQIMQDRILEYLLDTPEFRLRNAQKNGIFVEAGAYDGETWSNTLYLERFLNWTGLLIEPSVENYARLRSKHRNAYSINNCITASQNSVKKRMIEAGPFGITTNKRDVGGMSNSVVCHPLSNMLTELFTRYFPHRRSAISQEKADNVMRFVVDYLSLDIEGFEHDTIKTFPWNKFQFNFINIEYNQNRATYKWVKNFLRKFGYYETFVDDVWYQDLYLAHKSVYSRLDLSTNKVSEFMRLVQ